MELKRKHHINYKLTGILIVISAIIFNIFNHQAWNTPAVLFLLIIFPVLNIYISKLNLLYSKKRRLRMWINYSLTSALIWFLGGINNPSFHIYQTLFIILTITLIGLKDGLAFLIISNILILILHSVSIVDSNYLISFIYFTIGGLFIGYFLGIYIKNTERLDKKVKEFESLYKISKMIDSFPDTQVIFDNVAKIVANTLDIDECLIMLYDKEQDILSTKARYGSINPDMESAIFTRGEGASGKVLVTKESIISSDLSKDKDILGSYKYDFGIQACAIVPLINKDESIGVIAVYSVKKYEFDKDTIELLDIIASRIVSLLESDSLYKKVKQSSITDGLTRLYNHRYFYEMLDRELDEAEKLNYHVYLLMLDIDKFKSFNDTYGHLLGDKVLREIADIIKENIRHTDIAARYGGEEFAIILPNTHGENAQKVAKRISQRIKTLNENIEELKDSGTEITVSIGIACYPHCANDVKALVDKADLRMYIAKRNGGDNIKFKNIEINMSANSR